MLDKECKEDIHRVLIGNKADLKYKRKMLATEGMAVAIENGMHRYLEVSAKQDFSITSAVIEMI